jgi:hypothetical protein
MDLIEDVLGNIKEKVLCYAVDEELNQQMLKEYVHYSTDVGMALVMYLPVGNIGKINITYDLEVENGYSAEELFAFAMSNMEKSK